MESRSAPIASVGGWPPCRSPSSRQRCSRPAVGRSGSPEGTGDRAKGKELFIQKCGSCHTLADAGTKGQIGPNLDDAFRRVAARRARREHVRPGRPRADRVPDHEDVDRSARGCPRTSSRARTRTTSRATSAASRDSTPRARRAPSTAPAPDADPASGGRSRRCRRREDRVRLGRLRRLPHARRRRLDRQRRGRTSTTRCPTQRSSTERVTNGKGVMPPFKGQLTRPRSPTSPRTSPASPASSRSRAAAERALRHKLHVRVAS